MSAYRVLINERVDCVLDYRRPARVALKELGNPALDSALLIAKEHERPLEDGGRDERAVLIFVLVYIDGRVVAFTHMKWFGTPDGAVDLRPTAGVLVLRG